MRYLEKKVGKWVSGFSGRYNGRMSYTKGCRVIVQRY